MNGFVCYVIVEGVETEVDSMYTLCFLSVRQSLLVACPVCMCVTFDGIVLHCRSGRMATMT